MSSAWDEVGAYLFNWLFLPLMIVGAFILSVTWVLDGARPDTVRSSLLGNAMQLLFLAFGYRHYFRRGARWYFYSVFCLPVALSATIALAGVIGLMS